jgi:lipopolysaccharide/colanic/teichoic acid biosynthesis glycosyltransferase
MSKIERATLIPARVNFSVDSRFMKDLEDLLGTNSNIDLAKAWIHSPKKKERERKWAAALLAIGLFPTLSACLLNLIAGGFPLSHQIEVGFLGPDEKIIQPTRYLKLRTLKREISHQEANLSPFKTTVFQGGSQEKQSWLDPRAHSLFGALLRKSSLDEIPQLLKVIEGGMALIGPRGYTAKEIEGLEIIFRHLAEIETIGPYMEELKSYPKIMAEVSPLPGIFGPYALRKKTIGPAERLICDLRYCKSASPEGDTALFWASIKSTLKMTGAR